MFGLSLNNMSICRALEVVGRGSETQRQVRENLNYLISHFKNNTGRGLNCYQ